MLPLVSGFWVTVFSQGKALQDNLYVAKEQGIIVKVLIERALLWVCWGHHLAEHTATTTYTHTLPPPEPWCRPRRYPWCTAIKVLTICST